LVRFHLLIWSLVPTYLGVLEFWPNYLERAADGQIPPDTEVHPKLFWFGIFLSILLFSIFLSFALIGTFGFIATAMR
jgi:nitrate reductase NapE component